MGAGLLAPVQAEEVHMIMCGGEIREADQVVISAFEAKYIQALQLMLKQFLGEHAKTNQ